MSTKFKIIILILFSLEVHANEITVSGKIESGAANSTKSLYIEGAQKNQVYQTDATFRTLHSYIKINGKDIKYRALFDYEQLSRRYHNKTDFYAIYFRHKNDRFRNSEYQNYSIVSIGKGISANKNISMQFFVGKRFGSQDIYIVRPAIKLKATAKDFSIVHKASFIRGENYKLIKNKVKLIYKLSEKVSIKYIIDIEESQLNDSEVDDKSNILALGIKF